MGSGILVLNQPGVYLVDADGNVVTIADGGTIGDAEAVILAGKDGSVARMVKVSSAARLVTDGSEVTQPISASALPLPTGAATEATLATRATEATLATRASAAAQTDGTQKTQVNNGANILGVNASGQAAIQNPPNLDAALSSRATETTLAAIKDTDGVKKITDALPTGDNTIGRAKVTDGTNVLAVDASGRAAIQDPPNLDVALSTRATEATLASIKDTDGIKKITDQLPAGTNEIGKVAQGTKAAGSGAWSQVLYDASGNAVGVVLDDTIYRLQADSKVAEGTTSDALVHLEAIDTVSGRGRLKTTVYTPDGDPVAFGATSASIKNDFVKNGSNPSLLVNGSVTPVVFEYLADATYDISLQEIKFTMASNSITFGSNYFGATSGPLTNGLLVEVVTGGSAVTICNLTQNECFVNFSSPGGFEWVVSSKDMLTSDYVIGGGLKLIKNSSDMVRVTVRDNISSAGVYFRCFIKGNLLTQV